MKPLRPRVGPTALVTIATAVTVLACSTTATTVASSSTPENTSAESPTTRSGSTTIEHITVDGRDRVYEIHVPDRLSKTRSVVLALHGNPSDAAELRLDTRLDSTADRHGFIAVYPQGLDRSWNDGRGVTDAQSDGINDVSYLTALIDTLVATRQVNPRRVYLAGFSNGAFMAEKYACTMPRKIAAIAAVEGTVPAGSSCRPKVPVSVMQVHSTTDDVVPFNGGNLPDGGKVSKVKSARSTAARWRKIDKCKKKTTKAITSRFGRSVTRELGSKCSHQTEVALYVLRGWPHTWQGGVSDVSNSGSARAGVFNASESVWRFFNSHPRR